MSVPLGIDLLYSDQSFGVVTNALLRRDLAECQGNRHGLSTSGNTFHLPASNSVQIDTLEHLNNDLGNKIISLQVRLRM